MSLPNCFKCHFPSAFCVVFVVLFRILFIAVSLPQQKRSICYSRILVLRIIMNYLNNLLI